MHEFLELVVRGVLLGVTYGLLAFPISLLFTATETVDLAVGAYAVLAGAVTALIGGPLGIIAGIAIAVLCAGVVGAVSLRLNRRQSDEPLVLVLASFGFALFLESFVLTFFGKDPFIRRSFAQFWSVGDIRISPQAAVNLAVGLFFLSAIYVLLYRTPWGRDMRASAVNVRGAALAGIHVRVIQFSTFLLTGLLSGVSGVLILYTSGMDFSSGLNLTLSAFGAAIVFGMQGPLRGFFGGLAIGIVEALGAGYANGAVASLLPLLFIFAVLATGSASRLTGARA